MSDEHQLYYYLSVQHQDEKPYRVVRVWDGQHKTIMHSADKGAAERFIAGLPTHNAPITLNVKKGSENDWNEVL